MLKRFLFVAVAVALAVPLGIVAVSMWGQAGPTAQAQTAVPEVKPAYSPTHTITVVGQGTTRVVPNIANVSIGVETQANTVADASQENQTKMKGLLAALKQVGIPDKDIQTSNYSITWNRPPEPIPGVQSPVSGTLKYTVSNMVNVTVRDLTLISDVLDSATEAGANSIWGINFSVDKPDAAQAEARASAVADAQARAAALAKLGGVKLGPVMSMSEIMSGGPMPVAYESFAAKDAAGGTPISPGEVEVSYQVQVVFYIED